MQKHIPYEKLSKKARRAEDRRHRGDWGTLNPVTRRTPDLRHYDRKASRVRGFLDDPGCGSFVLSGETEEQRQNRTKLFSIF